MEFVNEELLTEGQKSKIGLQWETPKGGVLTVIGVVSGKTLDKTMFALTCSICNKDRELFPQPFVRNTAVISNKRVCCNCVPSFRFTVQQYEVLAKRYCEALGVESLGMSGEFKGDRTIWKIKYKGVEDFTSIESLSNGKLSYKLSCLKRAGKIPLCNFESFLDKVSPLFPEGTIFSLSMDKTWANAKGTYYIYKCPVCSEDMYTKAGVCTGRFISYRGSLSKGIKACRCSKGYRWKKNEIELYLNHELSKIGWKFGGWLTDYKKALSFFNFTCDRGHYHKLTVNDFKCGTRCGQCALEDSLVDGRANGYFPERENEQDYLYLLDFQGEFIKIGRSFNIKARISKLRSESSIKDVNLIYYSQGNHGDVYRYEQQILDILRIKGYTYTERSFSKEIFKNEALSEAFDLVSKFGK
ncbi:putative homing endonuclease [Vibrio phage ICP1]|nr:putative homing endonuclease [Vibrio phage ICP1]